DDRAVPPMPWPLVVVHWSPGARGLRARPKHRAAGGVGWASAIRVTCSPQRCARMRRIDGSSKRLKADATEQGSEDGGGPPDAAGRAVLRARSVFCETSGLVDRNQKIE